MYACFDCCSVKSFFNPFDNLFIKVYIVEDRDNSAVFIVANSIINTIEACCTQEMCKILWWFRKKSSIFDMYTIDREIDTTSTKSRNLIETSRYKSLKIFTKSIANSIVFFFYRDFCIDFEIDFEFFKSVKNIEKSKRCQWKSRNLIEISKENDQSSRSLERIILNVEIVRFSRKHRDFDSFNSRSMKKIREFVELTLIFFFKFRSFTFSTQQKRTILLFTEQQQIFVLQNNWYLYCEKFTNHVATMICREEI